VSTAVTEGIEISVQSVFRADRSAPGQGRFLYTNTVQISNGGAGSAKLLGRHWIITDARGEREEVTGDGVIGQQPELEPGQSFQYTSFCVLKTPLGQMRGSYTMMRADGTTFQAEIAPFALVVPAALN
jgi:ApaG protein